MDGRGITVLALLVLPAILIGVTVWLFSSNPLAIFILLGAMIVGGFYLLSYNTSFN
jgi:hypothetical protein